MIPGLRIRVGSLPWFEVIVVAQNRFMGTDVGVEFTFEKDEQGLVKGVTWQRSDVSFYYPKNK